MKLKTSTYHKVQGLELPKEIIKLITYFHLPTEKSDRNRFKVEITCQSGG